LNGTLKGLTARKYYQAVRDIIWIWEMSENTTYVA